MENFIDRKDDNLAKMKEYLDHRNKQLEKESIITKKLIDEFNLEEYSTEMKELNELTGKILKKQESCKVNKNDGLSDKISEISKQKLETSLPPIAVDLKKLGLYGVYSTSNDKFVVNYIDFDVESHENLIKENPTNFNWSLNSLQSKPSLGKASLPGWKRMSDDSVPSVLSLGIHSKSGIISEKFIPIGSFDISISIENFINSEFIKKIKELSIKNRAHSLVMSTKEDKNKISDSIIIKEIDNSLFKQINARLVLISNYILSKGRMGSPNFIFASRKNIEIIDKINNEGLKKNVSTYIYDNNNKLKYNLVINDELGDTVIVGRTPNDDTNLGINLVINEKTLNNYTFSEDDITGINLGFEFVTVGNRPEYNYYSFEMREE